MPKVKSPQSRALKPAEDKNFVKDLGSIVSTAREMSFRAANLMQVACNWLIGWRIVEQEQHGKARAGYGKHVIQLASDSLTENFGKGFSVASLKGFRKFYLTFKNIRLEGLWTKNFTSSLIEKGQALPALLAKDENAQILPSQLSWSHYENLMRVADEKARMWYMQEAAAEQWDYRTLKRNIASQYYYRLVQTPKNKKAAVVKEMEALTADYQKEKSQFIKNPMIVEFLGLNQDAAFTESSLENAILTHLQKFLMEMGKGYALMSRQQHIHTEDDDYYIDLVFYNYLLKCFVLVDLKTRKISYEDVGQMDMYLKLYDGYKRSEGDNPTIGIILCSDTNADVAKFSTLATNKRMYAAKYLTYMPSKEALAREIEMQKEIFEKKRKG